MKIVRALTQASPVGITVALSTSWRNTRRALAMVMAATAAAWLPDVVLAQAARSNAVSTSASVTGLATFDSDLDTPAGTYALPEPAVETLCANNAWRDVEGHVDSRP
jgi:hypothetical protein